MEDLQITKNRIKTSIAANSFDHFKKTLEKALRTALPNDRRELNVYSMSEAVNFNRENMVDYLYQEFFYLHNHKALCIFIRYDHCHLFEKYFNKIHGRDKYETHAPEYAEFAVEQDGLECMKFFESKGYEYGLDQLQKTIENHEEYGTYPRIIAYVKNRVAQIKNPTAATHGNTQDQQHPTMDYYFQKMMAKRAAPKPLKRRPRP